MKYRIIETPIVNSEPIFWIEAWGHRMVDYVFYSKEIECWCKITATGSPINKGYRLQSWREYLHSFKSLEEAKEYLDKIIEYRKKEVKTVFEIET